ncbi:hypothetical protein K437DRAFT_27654 [Tilletiaria anomala UBC 951]|uniref:Uncharacterized protein n=1 Tax=Tilletiaria anomala (strain ATCC 24038 / CBS 436.72 / UBC 951) TaxID=1037660 RepID=A0A066V9D3_TILAU|nr:uncharacterized protein K437DRAFT_27654 [Tilletiaria anomala UBC 951]KDN38332.1 hypothetical protein K437DRAFT_27654 [Tilletiaria anomala UBC 951]
MEGSTLSPSLFILLAQSYLPLRTRRPRDRHSQCSQSCQNQVVGSLPGSSEPVQDVICLFPSCPLCILRTLGICIHVCDRQAMARTHWLSLFHAWVHLSVPKFHEASLTCPCYRILRWSHAACSYKEAFVLHTSKYRLRKEQETCADFVSANLDMGRE